MLLFCTLKIHHSLTRSSLKAKTFHAIKHLSHFGVILLLYMPFVLSWMYFRRTELNIMKSLFSLFQVSPRLFFMQCTRFLQPFSISCHLVDEYSTK